ncbi:MAG: hypothetical protein JRH18_22185 [Deltaproteobacteria bacterium]|nr:hypothetical protein [Deltaproteobacteria bacterium]MBW2154361.1 hypothetical protein [Deltaproteobacteria bacterium]
MLRNRSLVQFIWGIALVMAGIGVFFRTSQLLPRIAQIEQFASLTTYIRFCFYLIGIVLIGGGSKKIYDNYPRF